MNTGLLLIRGTLGMLLVGHGAQHALGWFGGFGAEGTGGWLEGFGFPPRPPAGPAARGL